MQQIFKLHASLRQTGGYSSTMGQYSFEVFCVIVSHWVHMEKDNALTRTDPVAEGWACARRLDVLIWYPLDNVLLLFWLQMTPEPRVGEGQSPRGCVEQGDNRVTHHRG